MSTTDKNEIIYSIDKEWLQLEAEERLCRELTEEEILIAKDCIEEGINTSIDIIFSAAIQQAISMNADKS
jgi:hypothetical protein